MSKLYSVQKFILVEIKLGKNICNLAKRKNRNFCQKIGILAAIPRLAKNTNIPQKIKLRNRCRQ